jgi:protease-4
MIRNDLCYAISAGRPMLIDPLKAKAFVDNANLLLNNPEIAYYLSAWTDKYESKATKPRKRPRAGNPWVEEDETETNAGMDVDSFFSSFKNPEIKDGVGCIPVEGVIGKGLTKIERMLGCADLKEIACTMDCWEKMDNVKEVVFKFDSGGGSTSGLEEMAKKIRNYPKTTIAYCEGDCGSAAFWLASQCTRFYVTSSSSIGACGIYLTLKNHEKKHQKEGIEIDIIKSGEYKAAGVENTGLSELQRQRLQDEVDELHRRFIRDVRSVRVFASEDDLQGQSFYGDEAVRKGLATNLVDGWKEVEESIKMNRQFNMDETVSRLLGNRF